MDLTEALLMRSVVCRCCTLTSGHRDSDISLFVAKLGGGHNAAASHVQAS